jgi:hypothetical protein
LEPKKIKGILKKMNKSQSQFKINPKSSQDYFPSSEETPRFNEVSANTSTARSTIRKNHSQVTFKI